MVGTCTLTGVREADSDRGRQRAAVVAANPLWHRILAAPKRPLASDW